MVSLRTTQSRCMCLMACQPHVCSVCRSAGLPWWLAHPCSPSSFMHPSLSPPPTPSLYPSYINLLLVWMQKHSESECSEVYIFLKKWYWASSLLFLAYMHELKTSPGMLPVFPSAGKIKASRIQEGYRKWASERSLFNMYGAQSEGMSTTSTFNHFYGPPFV